MPKSIRVIGPIVSPFVVKVLSAAKYKGLEFEHQGHANLPELKKFNPQTKMVPIVLIDGESVFDSTLILRRFDRLSSAKPLFSKDKQIRVQQEMLEDWADESLYYYMMGLRWCTENVDRTIAQNSRFVPWIVRFLAKPILYYYVGRRTYFQGMGRLPYAVLIQESGRILDNLVTMLGDKPFFFSEEPSAADFAVYGQYHCGTEEGVTPDFAREFSSRPELIAWSKRVEESMGC